MKKPSLFSLVVWLAVILFAQGSRAEDYTRLNLPEGALGRLGKGDMGAVDHSPDGTRIAVGSTIGIWLYDAAAGTEIALLTGNTGGVRSVSFSSDGQTLASGSRDGTILLWDMSPYVTPQSPIADFDGDGTVGFPDFLQFAAKFGLSQGDAGYDARFDLDGAATVGFSDFLIFAGSFGQGS